MDSYRTETLGEWTAAQDRAKLGGWIDEFPASARANQCEKGTSPDYQTMERLAEFTLAWGLPSFSQLQTALEVR